jgi:hypothetical protein
MLKDIRETLLLELQDPDVQREFILAYAEEEGVDGVLKALERIAEANRSIHPSRRIPHRPTFNTVRRRLNAVGLDLQVTTK